MNPLPPPLLEALGAGNPAAVLAETIRHFGCAAGTVHLFREGVLHLAADQGIPPPVVEIVKTVPIGKGIAGLAAERREPITICNLQTDSSGQARPGARATGLEGALAVPMLSGGKLQGVLGIAKAEAYDWPPEEIEVLSEIASRLAGRIASDEIA